MGAASQHTQRDRGSDRAALRRIALGDVAALEALYAAHAPKVFGLALRILRSTADAEEIVQETFLHAWTTAKSFDAERGDAQAWLVMMGRTRALDRVRSRTVAHRVETKPESFDPRPAQATPEQESSLAQSEHQLRRALGALPPEQAQVVQAVYFDGLTLQEVAIRAQVPLGTVKTRIRLAMQKLVLRMSSSDSAPPPP